MEDAILSFIHRAREPGVLTEDEVYLMLAYLAEVGVALPEVNLSTGERMSLSGHLFMDAPVIVDAVVDGVRRAPPGLFAEFEVDIEDLHGRTMRGRALRGLAYTLRSMAQRADDLATLDDSSATKDALKLLRSAMVPGRLRGSIEDLRRLYLRAAVYYWDRNQARKRQAALDSQPRSQDAPLPDPLAPAGSRPRPSPQRSAMKQATVAQAAQILAAYFPSIAALAARGQPDAKFAHGAEPNPTDPGGAAKK